MTIPESNTQREFRSAGQAYVNDIHVITMTDLNDNNERLEP